MESAYVRSPATLLAPAPAPRRRRRRRLWPLALLVAAIGWGGLAPPAKADPNPGPPINLLFYSQSDPTWGLFYVGAHEDVSMGRMGSLLTAVAMVATTPRYKFYIRFKAPGTDPLLAITPDYIHFALKRSNGYQASRARTVIMDYNALYAAFFTIGNDGNDQVDGLFLNPMPWPGARAAVDQNLNNDQPSILYLQPEPNTFHPVVVVGWDADSSSYLILDPAWQGKPGSASPKSMRLLYGANWHALVVGALIPEQTSKYFDMAPLISASTKSPVETLVVDPLGRRVGWDMQTGATIAELPNASYMLQPVWTDPYGTEPPLGAGRLVTIHRPIDGRYRFQMIGTGDGPYTLSVRARNAGNDLTVDQGITGMITKGQVVKYQIEYDRNGPSFFALGDNFAPEAGAGGDRLAAVNAPVAFDAGRSFDVDGTIVAYAWDFGDGATATGVATTHAYATRGVYTVRLTVTDDSGATASDSVAVSVFDAPSAGGSTERVSVATGGAEPAGGAFGAFSPAMSADGRYVAFESYATNLGGPLAGPPHVFVRDRQSGTTTPISAPFCTQSRTPDMSADGRFIAYTCFVDDAGTSLATIAVHDLQTGAVERADVSSAGEGGMCASNACGSVRPALSADGRFVAFYSDHANLVAGDTNGVADVFVRDRVARTTERSSVTSTGAESAAGAQTRFADRLGISGDGRYVAFASVADLTPGLFVGTNRVFVRDRQARTTELASVSSSGAAGNSDASQPSISADGRVVAFASLASNLVAGDNNGMADVFVRDRAAGTTERVSLSGAGAEVKCALPVSPSACSRDPVVSADGRYVVFRSQASTLVLNDGNGVRDDVFIRDRQTANTELVSVNTSGVSGNGASGEALFTNDETRMAVSANGRFVAFVSDASDLIANDANGQEDVFVRDGDAAAGGGTPMADASGPYIGWATSAARAAFITFDARGSLDPAGRALTARWDFGDGTPVASAPAGSPMAHAYAAPGLYTAKLVVGADGTESTPATTVVQVLPQLGPPALTKTPACGSPGDVVTLAVEPQPLVAAAGGWNLAGGALPSVRSKHPSNTVRLAFGGPASADLSDEAAGIRLFSMLSPLDFSTSVKLPIRPSWVAGAYRVSAPDDGGVDTAVTVPCPSLGNEPPHANVGGPYVGVAGSPIAFDGSKSFDPEGKPLTYTWYFEDGSTATGVTPSHAFRDPGTYGVVLVINDGQYDSPTSVGTHSFTTAVIGQGSSNRAPACGVAKPSVEMLWPPNHVLVPVGITGVTDPDGDAVDVIVTGVRQDEAVNGLGDGDAAPDAVGVGTGAASVRAERSGTGDGRVYHIAFAARDRKGGECNGKVTVCVPKDQGRNRSCVDQGPLYDSTAAP